CKGIVNIPKKGEVVIHQEDLPPCPAIDCPGHIMARKSRFGKTFYSCSTYPDCDVIVNNLEDIASKYPEHPRTPYVKKAKRFARKGAATPAKAAKGKTAKEKAPKEKKSRATPQLQVSEDLAKVVGASEMGRGEVMKKVWDYIKANNLQDAQNKRLINP